MILGLKTALNNSAMQRPKNTRCLISSLFHRHHSLFRWRFANPWWPSWGTAPLQDATCAQFRSKKGVRWDMGCSGLHPPARVRKVRWGLGRSETRVDYIFWGFNKVDCRYSGYRPRKKIEKKDYGIYHKIQILMGELISGFMSHSKLG